MKSAFAVSLASLGVALLIGAGKTAQAQGFYRPLYPQVADVQGDQWQLRNLERQRSEAVRCRNWPLAHEMDQEISELRWHIRQDEIRIRLERRRRYMPAYRDHDDWSYRDHDDWRPEDRPGRYRSRGDREYMHRDDNRGDYGRGRGGYRERDGDDGR